MLIEHRPGCVEAASRILGDKWTPLLVRALATEPLRFCELQKAAGGINPRTLSARLNSLDCQNIIKKSAHPSSAAYNHYMLTEKGEDLIPILRSMAEWGDKYHTLATAATSANPPATADAG